MSTYTAKSLADIAKHFQDMSLDCSRRANSARLVKDRVALSIEARVWRQARDVLCETTLESV